MKRRNEITKKILISSAIIITLTIVGAILHYRSKNNESFIEDSKKSEKINKTIPTKKNLENEEKKSIKNFMQEPSNNEQVNRLIIKKSKELKKQHNKNNSNNSFAVKPISPSVSLPDIYGKPLGLLDDKIQKQPNSIIEKILTPIKRIYKSEPIKVQPKQSLLFSIDFKTSFCGSKNQALLNSCQQFDETAFFETIINAPINVEIPMDQHGKIEFNLTGRARNIWGSTEASESTLEFVKIGRSITETKHYHDSHTPPVTIRETWLKIFSKDEKTTLQLGIFPKQIGLGLVLGNNYKSQSPILTSVNIEEVDQFRPGIEFSHQLNDKGCKASIYYSLYKNNASFDRKIEFEKSQQLKNCGSGPPFIADEPSRTSMQINHLATLEVDIPCKIKKDSEEFYDLHIKPFAVVNIDKNQKVEFDGDAESKMLTIGSSFNAEDSKFNCSFDIAANIGHQKVYGWDRNVTEEHAQMTQTHLFRNGSSATPWLLATTFPKPYHTHIALEHAAGAIFREFTTQQYPKFQNSFSRFRKEYKNNYRSFMAALDFGYNLDENKKIGFIAGFASGDENPNDSTEKAILHRQSLDIKNNSTESSTLSNPWTSMRSDLYNHTYSGFIGLQSLYTGKNVQSMHLLRSEKISNPISQVRELTVNKFSNLAYLGISFEYKKDINLGELKFNCNWIGMAMPHAIKFGFDPTIQDVYEIFNWNSSTEKSKRFENYNKKLSKYLGTEINMSCEISRKENLSFYAAGSMFIPGSYYNDIKCYSHEGKGKVVPLKNQYTALAKDQSGFENIEKNQATLKDDIAINLFVGVKFEFDTISFNNPFRRREKIVR